MLTRMMMMYFWQFGAFELALALAKSIGNKLAEEGEHTRELVVDLACLQIRTARRLKDMVNAMLDAISQQVDSASRIALSQRKSVLCERYDELCASACERSDVKVGFLVDGAPFSPNEFAEMRKAAERFNLNALALLKQNISSVQAADQDRAHLQRKQPKITTRVRALLPSSLPFLICRPSNPAANGMYSCSLAPSLRCSCSCSLALVLPLFTISCHFDSHHFLFSSPLFVCW